MAGSRMSDLPDLTRISSGGSCPMLFNKTSHASLIARDTARPAEGRIHLSATPWITTVGRGDLPIIASRLRPSRPRVIRRAESSTPMRPTIPAGLAVSRKCHQYLWIGEVQVTSDPTVPASVVEGLVVLKWTQRSADLNGNDIDAAAKIIAGTARSMGITVE
jgi:Ribosomal protein L11, RNA binding domain